MDTSNCYPTKYLSAADLKGQRVRVTIREDVNMETLRERDGKSRPKPVLYFKETKKGLVVNVTNLNTIWSIMGTTHSEKWIGKQIVLFPEFQSGVGKEGIRIARVDGNGATAKSKAEQAFDPFADGDDDEDGLPAEFFDDSREG